MEIYTNDNRLIGRYNATGFNRGYSAFYYGYRMRSLTRVVGIKAFKMAMNDIIQKIANDQERLMVELSRE